jgi:hypothetical protein
VCSSDLLDETAAAPAAGPELPAPKNIEGGGNNPEVDHPVLQLLKRELDAERME